MIRKLIYLSMLLSFTSLPLFAFAKGEDDRVANLERELANLQKTYIANNQDVASAVSRANAVQEEFNIVKGQAEATAHELKAQREELMRLVTDLQARLQAIEDRMGVFSSQMTSALGKVAPAAAAEAELYQKGLDQANASNYLEAAATFESFLDKYPRSQFSSNSLFWIGECFYDLRDYKRAIKEYQNFIEKYPRDPKAATATFKQGNSFYELGLLDESRAFYEKVIASYPSSAEAGQAKAKLARIDERKNKGVSGSGARGTGSYPTETIEQQRDRMSGAKTKQQGAGKTETKTVKKPVRTPREF